MPDKCRRGRHSCARPDQDSPGAPLEERLSARGLAFCLGLSGAPVLQELEPVSGTIVVYPRWERHCSPPAVFRDQFEQGFPGNIFHHHVPGIALWTTS
jgi:hypothetical protein